MRLLIFTDNHFCSNSSIVRSKGSKYSLRLENQIESLNWVNKVADDNKCDSIICLGDFFDSSTLNSEELSALKEIRWSNIPKYFLVGNHEMGSNDLVFNSTNALSSIGSVIDKPVNYIEDNCRILFLPYILESNKKKSISDYFNGLVNSSANCDVTLISKTIVLSHNDLAGIQLGRYISKSGFDLCDIESNCDLCVNGHLHNQSYVTSKILNIGNLTGQNFSEDGIKYKHSVAILDTDTLNIELIDNPYAFYFYKVDAKDIEDLESKVNGFSKDYAIGTIKIPSKYSIKAKEICKEHFKEFRILTTADPSNLNSASSDISTLIKADHITQFREYILNTLDNSEILLEELDLIK